MKDKYIVIETDETNEKRWPRFEVHIDQIAIVTENESDYCEGQDKYIWVSTEDLKRIIEAQEELIMYNQINKINKKQ